MKVHVIDQSLNKFIVMSYYLLPPVYQSSTRRLIFLSQLQRQTVAVQSNAKYELHH